MVDYTVVLNVVKKYYSNSSFILKYPCSMYTSTCTLRNIFFSHVFILLMNLNSRLIYRMYFCLPNNLHTYILVCTIKIFGVIHVFSFIPRQGHKKGSVSIYSKAFYLTWRELPPRHQNRGV